MKATEAILAGVFAGGGSGGGGGGNNTMLVSVDENTGVLDKTFSEIYNAMHSGKIVYISGSSGSGVDYDWGTFIITRVYYDDSYEPPKYCVETTYLFFVADAVDDYPYFLSDGD